MNYYWILFIYNWDRFVWGIIEEIKLININFYGVIVIL